VAKSEHTFAVWDGRFQPFHAGHVAVIRRILERYADPLVVMVIQSTIVASDDPYIQAVNRHHAPERNPLTFWERFQMISAALAAEGWKDRVTVLGILRPDLYWSIIRDFYPPDRYIVLTGKDEYERLKEQFWASLGETTRTINTADLPKVSASQVKASIKRGDGWLEMLHPATRDFFQQIDGVDRFAKARI
jgi:nicotinamide mononucleotide adenylyltransferase